MSTNNNAIDLVNLFGSVVKTLNQNKTALNNADSYNHDHGDNMVQIFEVITQAMKEKNGVEPADQLAYASELLRKQSASGSAKVYSEGLSDAAQQFSGQKSLSSDNVTQLIQLLLGASPTTSATASGSGEDILGTLLGSIAGSVEGRDNSNSTQTSQDGIDVEDLLNAGLSFLQTKQSGGSTMDALVGALTSSSKVGQQDYRAQSGALVATTLMNFVNQLSSTKK
jgi:hypothetical protein